MKTRNVTIDISSTASVGSIGAALAAALVACGSAESRAGFAGGPTFDSGADDGKTPAGPVGDGAPAGDGAESFGGDASSPPGDCPVEATHIYVVSDDDLTLRSFDPPTLRFTTIGVLACSQSAPPVPRPFEMSVARDGFAWVLYDDGNLYKVSTKDGSCTPTSYVPGQHGFTHFGLGFSSDGAGSSSESLFACWTSGLARIDTTSFLLTPIGPMAGLDVSSGCDMTGTSDGRLFAFVPEPATWVVAQIDKSTSAPMWIHPVTPPIPPSGGYATSFWGGDFYLFRTTGTFGGTSTLWRYRPSDQTTTQVVADVGFQAVGAGQSTCVPATPPQ